MKYLCQILLAYFFNKFKLLILLSIFFNGEKYLLSLKKILVKSIPNPK